MVAFASSSIRLLVIAVDRGGDHAGGTTFVPAAATRFAGGQPSGPPETLIVPLLNACQEILARP